MLATEMSSQVSALHFLRSLGSWTWSLQTHPSHGREGCQAKNNCFLVTGHELKELDPISSSATVLGASWLGFGSQFHHSQTPVTSNSYLTSLGLSFLICTMGIVAASTSQDGWEN